MYSVKETWRFSYVLVNRDCLLTKLLLTVLGSFPPICQNTDLDLNALSDEEGSAFPLLVDDVRDSHGTSCAGIIAMEKSNDLCGVGVAYRSIITGKSCHKSVYGCKLL